MEQDITDTDNPMGSETRQAQRPYFDAAHLPPAGNEYVSWVDVMGTQSSMSRSLSATANFVFKLHIAALKAPRTSVRLYPVMDGVYASSPSQVEMLNFLRSVFRAIASEFNQQADPLHRFIIRGGLAFGPVVHGHAVSVQSSSELAANPAYRDAILLGMPMVQAHLSEKEAPPFGIQVHESARVFASPNASPIHSLWWVWRTSTFPIEWNKLSVTLPRHLRWYEERSLPLLYQAERVSAHLRMAEQYFRL